MDIYFKCQYCGHGWDERIYSSASSERICPKCGDKNIEAKKLEDSKIDYYQGSPPFSKEEGNGGHGNNGSNGYFGF